MLFHLLGESTHVLEAREWEASDGKVAPLVEHLCDLTRKVVGGRLEGLAKVAHPPLRLVISAAN